MPLGRNFILFWSSIALRDSTRSWFLNTVTPSGICFFCLIIRWSEETFPRAPKINVWPRTGSNTDGIAPCWIMIFNFMFNLLNITLLREMSRLFSLHSIKQITILITIKKIWLFILWILTLISSFSSASAIDPMNLPKFEHFVNDYSNTLSIEQKEELEQLAHQIESSSGYQVVTVLFPHREGNELFDIALKAFNENKIWDKKRNDGLLLAIATEEKKIRIVVWYGLEDKIPDLLAKQIIETLIRPEVNNWNFHQGIKNFYSFFLDKSVQNQFSDQSSEEEDLRSQMIFLGVYTIFLLLLIIRGSSRKWGRSSMRNRWDRRNNSTLGSILGGGWSWSSSSGGWSSWSSGGRGGFSGGWGRSGGGGAGD